MAATAPQAGFGPVPVPPPHPPESPPPEAPTPATSPGSVVRTNPTWLWFVIGMLATGFWPTAWARRMAQAEPRMRQVLALGGLGTVVGLVAMWLDAKRQLHEQTLELVPSVPNMLATGWVLLAAWLWMAVLVRAQGWRGVAAWGRFKTAVALSFTGLGAAALWWWGIGVFMSLLSVRYPEAGFAWLEHISHWVAVLLAASAFANALWVTLRPTSQLALGTAGFFAITWGALACTPFMPWVPDWTESDMARAESLDFEHDLRPEVFERQQAAFEKAVASLAPPVAGRINLYGITFAPYASENVFRNETRMLGEVLASRFDAQGRVLTLLNHRETMETTPWATEANLRRAVQAVASVMDKERDVLFIYLTSHGGRDHRLAGSLWPLRIEPLPAQALRSALDDAGVRHRVVAVSACYSGGWIDVLRSDNTLVMTAADAFHTSYGCGQRSMLTYFGRAVFDEQLRTATRSFEAAFRQAVPIIAQREIEGGKSDGFSNPQMAVGDGIAAHLRRFEAQWPEGAAQSDVTACQPMAGSCADRHAASVAAAAASAASAPASSAK